MEGTTQLANSVSLSVIIRKEKNQYGITLLIYNSHFQILKDGPKYSLK